MRAGKNIAVNKAFQISCVMQFLNEIITVGIKMRPMHTLTHRSTKPLKQKDMKTFG